MKGRGREGIEGQGEASEQSKQNVLIDIERCNFAIYDNIYCVESLKHFASHYPFGDGEMRKVQL